MENSELQLNYSIINLGTFLEKHTANFRSLFDEKNIEFLFNNQTTNIEIEIVQELFSKAFTNLLSNDLKFTPTNE